MSLEHFSWGTPACHPSVMRVFSERRVMCGDLSTRYKMGFLFAWSAVVSLSVFDQSNFWFPRAHATGVYFLIIT